MNGPGARPRHQRRVTPPPPPRPGPGEAKGELKKRIKNKKLRGSVADLETADKMTDRAVATTIREHFAAAPKQGKKIAASRKRSKASG